MDPIGDDRAKHDGDSHGQTPVLFFIVLLRQPACRCSRLRDTRGHEHQRRERRDDQAADDGAAERRVLLATPSPSDSAIGSMPMIIASAVISTGRNRVRPASIAAATGSPSASSRSFANDTTSTLFAVTTPLNMSVPIRAGTLSGVCVTNRQSRMPASAAGSAVMMISGSSHD